MIVLSFVREKQGLQIHEWVIMPASKLLAREAGKVSSKGQGSLFIIPGVVKPGENARRLRKKINRNRSSRSKLSKIS